MIAWYGSLITLLALIVAVVCLVAFFRKQGPNDFTLGGTALIAVLLVIQAVIAIAAPAFGNVPTGDGLEFWLYLIVALAIPIGAGVWALVDRSTWSNLVLCLVNVSVSVMVFRMAQIWFVQGS